MRSRKSFPTKLLFVGVLVTLSVQALGKLTAPLDPLAAQWGMSRGETLERNLDKLSEEGTLDEKNFPWPDARFPAADGLILNRYQREDLLPESRSRLRALRLDEIKALSPGRRAEELSKFSPAEIFDLVRGLTAGYPLATEVRRLLNKPNPAGVNFADLDEKMSFGWAAAATSFAEPAQRTDYKIRFAEGTEATISIGSADVKALAAYYYGVKVPNQVKIAKVGSRCHGASDVSCKRIDPASFHILLANMIKRDGGKSFVMDIDPSARVDYRPIVGFKTEVLLQPEGYYKATTTVRFAKRRTPEPRPFGIFNLDSEEETYRYTLEVDAKHNLVRGNWLDDRHPEFVWRVESLPPVDFEGFSALKDLYQEAPIIR